MAKNTKEPKLASPASKEVLERLSKARLRPAMKLFAWCAGGAFAYVEISWTTMLVGESLRVLVDKKNDITSQFAIDDSAMNATATVDIAAVGLHLVDASGEFLAGLVPIKTIQISASTGVYIPF